MANPNRDSGTGRYTSGGGGVPVAEGSVRIGTDLSGVDRGLSSLRGKLRGFGSSVAGAMKSVVMAPSNLALKLSETATKIAFAFGGIATVFALAGKRAVDVASTFTETMSKFNTVFGAEADKTYEWAERFASAANRSKSEITGFLATTQDFFVPMGLARDKAAILSKTLVKLAVDIGSFANLETEEAFIKLISGVAGETEAVRRLGMDVSDTTMKHYGLKKGITAAWDTVPFTTKAVLRLQKMMQDSTDAQGDAIKTAHQWANATRGLTAQVENLWLAIGKHLIPILEPYLAKIVQIVKAGAEWVGQNPVFVAGMFKLGRAVAVIAGVAAAAAAGLAGLAIGLTPLGLLLAYLTKTAEKLGLVDFGVAELQESLGQLAAPAMEFGGAVMSKAKAMAMTLGSYLLSTLADVVGKVEGWLGTIWTKVKGLVGDWKMFALHSLSAVVAEGVALAIRGIMKIMDILADQSAQFTEWIALELAKVFRTIPGIGRLVSSDQDIRDTIGSVTTPSLAVSKKVQDYLAGALEDAAKNEAWLAGQEVNSLFGSGGLVGALQKMSADLAASGAALDPQANAALVSTIGKFQDMAGQLIQGMPQPSGTMPDWSSLYGGAGEGKGKGPKDTFGMWGSQNLRELMGFAQRDPAKDQLRATNRTNELLGDILSATESQGGAIARYAP